ncbi:hypothetical protein IEN85_19670 [Pelagicoccus sp. NFK12]|uniref:Uncharacterized protein n=1 Tax=Pelagicoccus enzymogenes TaxID=2773457 RepID=A0A927FC86_9BACT|nr:hypothetical protein [Pelagicoccus enzymogenes]MBD5781729.1 hypothetical protein [Pelagicoccus enzymogenes]MDQ8199991.1 hypothetical protein [Pelagicoccus enzymogenes]
MKSGDPEPIDDLLLVMAAKQSSPSRTLEVVSKSAQWLKAALKGAGVTFSYSSCEEENHYGYAAISIVRKYRGQPACLDIKIAEIRDAAYIFAEVRSLGKFEGTMFPFFGNLQSDDERDLLLHYIADFVISADD